MERLRWVNKNGKNILIIDFSNLSDPEETKSPARETTELYMQKPEKSILSVTHVEGMRFNNEIAEEMKKLAKDTEPKSKKAVISGMSGLQKTIFKGIQKFSERKFDTYNSLEEALEALAKE